MKKLLLFTALLLLPPLVLIILINIPFFKFAPGSTNTWIAFWGSYLGSLIGAATVYLVTSMQVKEQRKIQLESIKTENENAFNREMQQYYFQTQIDKIEEFYKGLEDLMDILMKSSNEFTNYITFTDILYGGEDEPTKYERKNFEEEIKKIRQGMYDRIHNINRIEYQLNRLVFHVDGTSFYMKKINDLIHDYILEQKEAYLTPDNSFQEYLENPNKPPLNHYLEDITHLIDKLSTEILQKKLEDRLKEMKSA